MMTYWDTMYPYVLLSSSWTSCDALGDLTLSSSGNLLSCAVDDLLPYDPMPNIHPMDSKTPVAGFKLPGIAGMSVESMESMGRWIPLHFPLKSLSSRSDSQWFFHFKTQIFINEHRSCPSFAAQLQQDHRLSCMPLPFIPLPGQAKLWFRGVGRDLGDFKNFKEKIERGWKC